MARRIIDPYDPRQISVQVSLRIPFSYREQLLDEAKRLDVSLPALIIDATERLYPPKTAKARS